MSAAACIHCGLCLEHCPTYVQLGHEADSPRGRILLMQAVADGRLQRTAAVDRHLDLCLDCRACETACPSGVPYGALIEAFRAGPGRAAGRAGGGAVKGPAAARQSRLLDHLLFHVVPDRRRLARWLTVGRWTAATGLFDWIEQSGLDRLVPPWTNRLRDMLTTPPAVEPLRESYRAAGPPRAAATLFLGCAGEAAFPQVNRATLRVLQRNGCAVRCPAAQTCCGAIHHHAGRASDAREFARRNIAALAGDEPVVTNVAGCGAMLKHYGELLAGDPRHAAPAAAFSRRVRDISEFLDALPLTPPTHAPFASRQGQAPFASRQGQAVPKRVTYHDPCHLCHAQSVRRQPRRMLEAIPGLELVPLAESEMCCGAAGTYNLTQPDMSDQLARRKLSHIAASGAGVVATGNAGCLLQIRAAADRAGLPLTVVHPIELLDRAYGAAST